MSEINMQLIDMLLFSDSTVFEKMANLNGYKGALQIVKFLIKTEN